MENSFSTPRKIQTLLEKISRLGLVWGKRKRTLTNKLRSLRNIDCEVIFFNLSIPYQVRTHDHLSQRNLAKSSTFCFSYWNVVEKLIQAVVSSPHSVLGYSASVFLLLWTGLTDKERQSKMSLVPWTMYLYRVPCPTPYVLFLMSYVPNIVHILTVVPSIARV